MIRDISGTTFFLGPNLVSFNRTVVPYEISKVNFRIEKKFLSVCEKRFNKFITVDHLGRPHTDALFHYFSRRSRDLLARLKMLGRWHLNPDVESQHRYESKYFHEKDLNNSYFVLFLEFFYIGCKWSKK
jgi:hypothetical protein